MMTDIPDGPFKLLEQYGYRTAEQVFYLAQAVGPELAQLTGMAPLDIQTTLANTANLLPQAAVDQVMALNFSLGVPIALAPPVPAAFSTLPVGAAPAAAVNHVPDMPPVRDQGQRGTCVAHASVAVLEHALRMGGAPLDLSEQFLYWDAKQNDGIPTQSGTWLRIAFPLLQRDGVCLETSWAYQPAPCATEDCGSPPAGAIAEALTYRQGVLQVAATSVDDLKGRLAAGRCVAFSVPVFRSWFYNAQVRHDGEINMPVPNDVIVGGHAMCLVGYEDSAAPGIGGGRFILRNSWSTAWAASGRFGAGYGTIPYAYLARYCQEAFSLP